MLPRKMFKSRTSETDHLLQFAQLFLANLAACYTSKSYIKICSFSEHFKKLKAKKIVEKRLKVAVRLKTVSDFRGLTTFMVRRYTEMTVKTTFRLI